MQEIIIERVWLRPAKKPRPNPSLIYRLSNGKEKTVTLACSNATAQEVVRVKRDEIARGKNRPEQHIPGYGQYRETLLEFSERYLSELAARLNDPITPVSRHTYRIREQSLKKLYRAIGNIEVARLSQKDIETFKRRLANQHAIGSINTYIRHCAAAFTSLVGDERNNISRNPFQGKQIAGPSGKFAGARYYTDEEQLRIDRHLAKWPVHWHYFATMLSLLSGLRVAGILNANKNRMYKDRGEWMLEIEEKFNKTRDVPIPDNLLKMIEKRIELMESPKLADNIRQVVGHKDPAPYLQRAAEGFLVWEVMSEENGDTVTRMFGRHLKRINQDKQQKRLKGSFHWLRHSFAKNYLDAGGDMATLSELLGHSDIRITYKHYGHITNRRKRFGINERVYKPVGTE